MELHLLKHPSLSETEIGFPVSGSNKVEKVRYDEETRRLYFNKEQYSISRAFLKLSGNIKSVGIR